jgi:hypothetical protein
MKCKYLCALLLGAAASLYSCDDSTTGIGDTMIGGNDSIPAGQAIYQVSTRSLLVDSVYARTSTAYLGRYTDPEFGEFSADFMTQFYSTDDFEFPEYLQEVTGLYLYLQYQEFFGDSLNAMRLQVDTLNKVIPESDKRTFYTNLDPSEFIDTQAKPIAEKAYAAAGTGTDIYDTLSIRYYTQSIKLPLSLGKYMYAKYEEDHNNYKDAEQFINNVLKGVYVRCTHGDGTLLYISSVQLRMNFTYLLESSTGQVDSLVNGSTFFASTKEIIQANRFTNSEKLKELVEEKGHTYLKTPAGIVTEATLPMEEIYEEHQRDTLNAAALTFTRYNETSDKAYPLAVPSYLLMIRKSDLYSFFENNQTYDGETSYLASFTSSSNTYTFSNIARLITYCLEEKRKGELTDPAWTTKNPDWNKVVLIPVKTVTDASSNIIGVQNALDMESARLVGGVDGKTLPLQVLYTTFK